MDKFGVSGYAYWFLLIELCSEKWDGESEPEFNFHTRIVRERLRISSAKLQAFLDHCSTLAEVSFNFNENSLKISMPIMLKIKTSRKPIKNSKNYDSIYIDIDKNKNKIESKSKNAKREKLPSDLQSSSNNGAISHFSNSETSKSFLENVKHSVQEKWIEIYSDVDWINTEILKASTWCDANPTRAPKKNIARFMTSWLERSWESYRKRPQPKNTVDHVKNLIINNPFRGDE